MIREALLELLEGKDLDSNTTRKIFTEILEGRISCCETAAFLVALRIKGETYKEISAAASVIREKAIRINPKQTFLGIEREEPILDTCGTGGSGIGKFNISTAVAFVVASAGIKVAKHGNRSVSSSCGSADVLEALGIDIEVSPKIMEGALKTVGIGFLFAPLYHPAFKNVAEVRKRLRIRTIFNILGPLCNPAGASHQLLGVFDESLLDKITKALRELGTRRAFVVYSKDLKDEVSISSSTKVKFLDGKKIISMVIRPSDFGLKKARIKDLQVKDAKESAKIIKDILNGKKGPARDVVLANSSCCFYILKKVNNLKEGVRLAESLIDEGKVKQKFLDFKNFLEKKRR